MKTAQSLLLSIILEMGITEGACIGINVQASADFAAVARTLPSFTAIQSFYPLHAQLQALKIPTAVEIPATFDHAFFIGTKHRQLNLSTFHRIFSTLKAGSTFLCVFENDIGAGRFEKEFRNLYQGPLFSIQKSKCRVFGTTSFLPEALNRQNLAKIDSEEQTGFLFNQGRLDQGSALLEQTVRGLVSGVVYEPCSGTGALSAELLMHNPAISELIGVEADWSSVELAKKIYTDHRAQFTWGDAAKAFPKKFHTVILNPPFHRGAKADHSLGIKCITAAAQSMDLQATLYVVQNEFLPYRKNLPFGAQASILTQENGFIVWQYKT